MASRSSKQLDAEHRSIPEVSSLRGDLRARRQSIIDAAVTLMFDADLDTIQVRDVAEASGVALGTVYRYFSSKDHLFACALLSWASGFSDQSKLTPNADLSARVSAIYRTAVRAFEKQPRVYGVMVEVQHSKDGHAAAAFGEFAEQQSERFEAALEGSDVAPSDRRVVVDVMGAVLNENLRRWHRGLQDIRSVYSAIDQASELICGPGPSLSAR
jgi:AcrR family transcriptional regulator